MTDASFWYFAQNDPEVTALIDPSEKQWTRGELLAFSNKITHALHELGLRKGDVVAVMLHNCTEMLAVYLACAQSGWYLVPINWHLTASEAAYIIEDSEAKAFFCSAHLGEVASNAVETANFDQHHAISVEGELRSCTTMENFIENQPGTMPDEASRTAGATMNYTSGTTGKPKGVRRALQENTPEQMAGMVALYLLLFGIEAEDGHVNYTGSPLYHTAVLAWASCALHLGHPLVLVDKWDAARMLHLIEKYKVTYSHMVPTQFRRLLLLPEEERQKYDMSSLRRMIHAAAPCPVHVKQQMLDWWGDTVYEYYAATEGGGTLVPPEEWRRYPGTVGRPWMGSEIRILDDDGNGVPQGEQGTVYMKLMEQSKFEYKGDREKTAKNRVGDFFTVGDIGYLNEEGYLFLCDRKIDMIISGGANIYPAEIESVLLMHPKIADVAVFGIPNDDWGEEIKAVVEPAPGVVADQDLTDDILSFATEKMAKFKLPRSIDYTDAMPRDPNGKLFKRRLRDPYWEGHKNKMVG